MCSFQFIPLDSNYTPLLQKDLEQELYHNIGHDLDIPLSVHEPNYTPSPSLPSWVGSIEVSLS